MHVMGKNDEVEARHLLSSVKGHTDFTSLAGESARSMPSVRGRQQQKKSRKRGRGRAIAWVLARREEDQKSALAMFCCRCHSLASFADDGKSLAECPAYRLYTADEPAIIRQSGLCTTTRVAHKNNSTPIATGIL
jgi:hypothetical protein